MGIGSKHRKPTGVVVAIAAATVVSTAWAQSLPDIEDSITQGSQIDEVIRGQERLNRQLEAGSNEIDGEAGIYVLTQNKIFIAGASAGAGYSGNPVRTTDDEGGSFFGNFATTAGVQTILGETVDFGARVNFSGIQYIEKFAPSSRNVNGVANFGMPIQGTPLYASVSGFGGVNFDDSFDDGTAFYGTSLSMSAAFQVDDRTVSGMNLGVARQWNENEDNNSVSASLGANIGRAIASRWSVGASARASRTWYDDFFEDVTFVSREDWTYGGSVSVRFQAHELVTILASGGYEKRDSTFFLSEYDSVDTSLLVSASLTY
ncbi:MAG: hypothetical protein AAGC77_13650 [Pseudomonadota bacterium]